jgi:hypothetical protein
MDEKLRKAWERFNEVAKELIRDINIRTVDPHISVVYPDVLVMGKDGSAARYMVGEVEHADPGAAHAVALAKAKQAAAKARERGMSIQVVNVNTSSGSYFFHEEDLFGTWHLHLPSPPEEWPG